MNRSVYIEIIFLVQKTISHTIVVSRHLGSFFKLKKTSVVQFQNKRLSNIFVFLSLFIRSVNVRVCYVPLFFCLFLSFFYLCYIFYFDVSCMYVWVLRVHSTTIIVYFIPSLTTTSLSQSSCVLTKYKNKKDIFPSFLSHSLSWMLTFLDSLQWRLKIWREIDLLSV